MNRAEVNGLRLGHEQILSLMNEKTQRLLEAQLENNGLLLKNLEKSKELATHKISQSQAMNSELPAATLLDRCIEIIQSESENHSEICRRLLQVAENKVEAIQARLVETLRFQAMTERRDNIDDAHYKTFQWIFQDTSEQEVSWASFAKWLQNGAGVYWINGKAGSGKSTLMRFILSNPQTSQCLSHWIHEAEIKVGAFFFWRSGTRMQRTQIGLFRSLLHEALAQKPELVPEIFPDQWLDARLAVEKGTSINDLHCTWSLRKLQEAFSRLTNLATTSLKFCFFIDGLDEYEGDQDSLAQFYKTLSTRPHIKLCVSSRPWLAFEDAFQQCPGLKLQDLTYNDIMRYAQDEFEDKCRGRIPSTVRVVDTSALVGEIVTKANGVSCGSNW